MRNPGEPTRPRVAQMFYAQHRKEEIRREGMAVSTVDLNAQCREEWKTLTDAQRMPFEHLERSDKERYDQEMLSYVPPPPVVPGIDASRFTKSGRLKKDPDRPKHPHSAYFYYMEANRPQVMSERAGASVPEITRALASGWKDLTDEGRQPYNDLAARDKERFANELQQYAPSAEFMAVQEQYARAKEQRRADKHAASLGVGPRDPMTQLLLAHGQEYPASADGMAGSSMAHSAQAAAVGYDAQAAAAAASLLDHDHQHVGLGMGGMVGGKRDASHLYAAHDDDDEDAVLLATPAADHEAAAAAAAAVGGYDGEKKKRGRPKGSKNKPKDPDAPPRFQPEPQPRPQEAPSSEEKVAAGPTAAEASEADFRAFNLTLDPSLSEPGAMGVEPLTLPAEAAAAAADCLAQQWQRHSLTLGNGQRIFGYATYKKTLAQHSASLQRAHTLLITNAYLDAVREHLPGFRTLEASLVQWLGERRGVAAELFFAHALRQSPATLAGTGFSVHQDTEEFDFIEYTIVVKLTPDALGEAPSAMRVIGAAGGDFAYGPAAGAAGCFDARLHHASVAPSSESEHLKIAFFFRRAHRQERLVARPNLAEAEWLRMSKPDCGRCRNCLDMVRFGGPNKTRQRCVERGGK